MGTVYLFLVLLGNWTTAFPLREADPFGSLPGKSLCYRISRYPRPELHRKLSPAVLRRYVDNALVYAISIWQKAVDVEFHACKRSQRADIEVIFATFYHGDEYPFDGAGNEVAHAFFPTHRKRRGQIHIDDNEPWGPTRGRNLFWVLAHELGHSLGFDHSPPGIESIMTAQYKGYETALPRLYPYDYQQIRVKYSNPTAISHENSVSAENLEKEGERSQGIALRDLCSLNHVDTIFSLPNGDIYVVKDEFVWRLMPNGTRSPGFPIPLSKLFPSVTAPVDAIFTDRFDWTWIIKGNQVWKVDASGSEIVVGSPMSLREASPFSNFAHSAVNAVLAVNAPQDAQPSVFFLGNKYWVDDNYDGSSDDNLEHQISEIFPSGGNVPERVDGALWLPHNGSFLFSGSQFWKVQLERTTLRALPGFPKSTREHLFGC